MKGYLCVAPNRFRSEMDSGVQRSREKSKDRTKVVEEFLKRTSCKEVIEYTCL